MHSSTSSGSTPISSAVAAASFSRGMKQWPFPVLCDSSKSSAASMRLLLPPSMPSSSAIVSASAKVPPISALHST